MDQKRKDDRPNRNSYSSFEKTTGLDDESKEEKRELEIEVELEVEIEVELELELEVEIEVEVEDPACFRGRCRELSPRPHLKQLWLHPRNAVLLFNSSLVETSSRVTEKSAPLIALFGFFYFCLFFFEK